MYLIDTRKYDDSFLLAKILEKVDFTDEETKKLFIHFEIPAIDAVEVVRCKDCAYWGTKVVYANGERADCLNFNFVTPCGFFCKWGERREDETN